MGVYHPILPDTNWQIFMAEDVGLSTNFIQTFEIQGNDIWLGRGDGLDMLDDKGTPFNVSDDEWNINISNENVSDMNIDSDGTLWLGSATGLYVVPPASDGVFNVELPPEISGSVNSVAFDGVGQLWVGTVTGLGVLKPNRDNPEQSHWKEIFTTSNSPLLNNKINDIIIDIATGIIYLATNGGLSVFDSGILPPTSDLSDMDAFPNPAVLSNGIERIDFKRVPSTGTLSIYTVSGEIVARFDLSGQSSWDLKNSKGERVAGGVYIFHVKSGDKSGTGKFAIIK
jgi:hypothetical protein